jgi:hypothetical protein
MHDCPMGIQRRPVPLDFAGIIGLWPTVRDFCDETRTPDATCRAWRNRDRIPPEHWDIIIAAASRRGIRLSVDALMGALRIAMSREAGTARVRPATAAALRRRSPPSVKHPAHP